MCAYFSKDVENEFAEKDLGIVDTIDEAIAQAKKAFEYYRDTPLEFRKQVIAKIRSLLSSHKEELAKMAVEETGLGRVEDKIAKNTLVLEKTPGLEMRDYGAATTFAGDSGLTFMSKSPWGIIGSVTPSTNPGATIINNSITMLSAGNVIVFNTHPGAKNVSNRAALLVNSAIRDAGSEHNLVFSVKNPTIESSQQLMKHPDIKLLVVTGGPDVVRTAMASGKKVIAAGPGNPPVIVDETAEIDEAAKDIVTGASFENNILCIAEKEVFVVDQVADELKKEMSRHKACEISGGDLDKLIKLIFVEKDGALVVNRKYIGKDAALIAKDAGISVPADTRLLFCEVGFNHPLVQHEQLMPVLPIVRVKDWRQGMEYAIKAEHGYHHTAIMHSENVERSLIVSRLINTSIFVENGTSLAGLGVGGEGFTSMTIAGPTGEGVTAPWTFVRHRRQVLVDDFRGAISSYPHG
ncbi:MAG: aldehyde dehydrogenase EutE [Candidatus Saganbacteria bacterium]|nr:aldehyde dehydrogenase EutE [Candidatus Saganbacteria bacterium]